jgi:hypothetical protein
VSPDLLDIIEERVNALDADLLPIDLAALHRVNLVAPDGSEITPAQALGYRVHAHVAELRTAIRMARQPRTIFGIPDLRPIPVSVQAAAVAVVVALGLLHAFELLGLLICWVQL